MDSSPLEDALSLNTESVPTSVSPVLIVESAGLVVAQRGRVRSSIALVADRGAQGEARACDWSAGVHRRRIHHQVWRWSRANRHGHCGRAVVGRVGLVGHRVHTRAVEVGSSSRRRARLIDSSPLSAASRLDTESVPTSVSPVVIVGSVDW